MELPTNCNDYHMSKFSITKLFGISPKITFECGFCNKHGKGRIRTSEIKAGRSYLRCNKCRTLNIIPIYKKS